MFRLSVTSPKGETSEVICSGDVATIGKSDENLIRVKGWTIAKRQATIVQRDGQYFIEDHGGLSYTEINGQPVEGTYGPMKPNDAVGVGGYSIRVLDFASPNQKAPAAATPAPAMPVATVASSTEPAQSPEAIAALLAQTLSRPVQAMTPRALSTDAPLPLGREGSAAVPAPAFAPNPAEVASFESTQMRMARPPAKTSDPMTATQLTASFSEAGRRMAEARKMVHGHLIHTMDLRRVDVSRMKEDELRSTTHALLLELVRDANDLPPGVDRNVLVKQVLDEVVGLGPLEDLLADDSVSEIMVNRFDEIFIERSGKLTKSEITFTSDNAVIQAIERIVAPLGRRIDESSPMVDARLKDGSRVNAVIPPLALKGSNITIRKFAKNKLQDTDLIKYASTTAEMMAFLKVAVEHGTNIVISGGTGSGKTTLLNVLSNYIPDDERIVTVEDAAELKLTQPNLVGLEARPPNVEGKGAVHIRDLVKNCLRMRPDRIVVGECRGGEALDMLQAMNTGHDGSLTTAHANTPRDCIARLEVMVLMSGLDLPIQAIREQISSAVHLIVQQNRFPDGSRKVTHITEITGIEAGVIQMQDIFLFMQDGYDQNTGKIKGRFIATGAIPELYQSLSARGIPVDLSIFQKGRAL